ncbi:hypothetical protein AJ79_09303 [Helicocarpus griseus UAMH5409]|uniref:Uncharacterized protein n=1 Tax=Helicocarpus griseus UAMH5409 TaxID=1447875 RepID=A0A2B7WKP0_9EURO|nr:hypothetical protein AJ79_09303 [Helicocarpus griseus UAMH5409]
MNLRGSRRETHDLDFLVLTNSLIEIRAVLSQYSWAILAFYELTGNVQERMFIDIGEDGQVVGVDIIRSGELGTPDLGEAESYETIPSSLETPQGDSVNVIHITWQVETKLAAWFGRRKESDFQDVAWLLLNYGDEIKEWSQFLEKDARETFYAVYEATTEDKEMCKVVKETLSL